MWFAYFSPLSLFVWPIALVIIGYFFFHWFGYKTTDYKISYTSAGKLSRRMGFYERFFVDQASANNTGFIHTVLLLESEVKLDQDHVKSALLMLKERFPLLRMRVTGPCFEEMEDPQNLDFRSIEDEESVEWQGAFEREINGAPFNIAQGPLWRVALLRETSDKKRSQILYRNTLLFSFHHAICDALSIYELKKKLVEFLGLLYDGGAIELKRFSLRPPIEYTMHHLITPGIWERLKISASFTFRRLRVMFCNHLPKNLYLSTIHPPGGDNSVAEKRCIIPRELRRDETLALIRCSKVNKCTVHGAITAATHLAMLQLLKQNDKYIKVPILIDSTFPVSIRKECQPPTEREEFGLYSSFDSLQITVNPSTMKSAQSFWKFARSCTNEVHRSIDSGKHRNFLKLHQCVNIPSFCALSFYETAHNLHSALFNLNNLGSLSIDQEGKSAYKFAGSCLALQSAKIGFVIGNNIFTINDRLYWTVEYSPEITTKIQAKEFVDLSLRILIDACSSSLTDSGTEK